MARKRLVIVRNADQAARWRAFFEGARRPLVLILALLVGVVAFAAVRQANAPSAESPPSGPSERPPQVACENRATREKCSSILVNGVVWRYSLARTAKQTSRTVVVDFGGPGVASLDDGTFSQFLSQHPDLASTYNVLVVEEPWVTRAVAENCKAAMSAFYQAIRDPNRQTGKVSTINDVCGIGGNLRHLWGFDKTSYQGLISAIKSKEALKVVGFAAHSFGAVRLSYLVGTQVAADLEWVVMSRPFPVGATAEQLVTARSQLIQQRLEELTNSFPALSPTRPAQRSIPVTLFDDLSAMIELGYLPDAEQPQAAADLRSGQRLATVATLSDQLWQRYGTASISPAFLARLDEICAAAGTPAHHPAMTLAGVLAAAFLPCAPLGPMPRLNLGATRLCIVTSPTDTVAPASLIKDLLGESSTNTRWVTSNQSWHQSPDGLDACLPHDR